MIFFTLLVNIPQEGLFDIPRLPNIVLFNDAPYFTSMAFAEKADAVKAAKATGNIYRIFRIENGGVRLPNGLVAKNSWIVYEKVSGPVDEKLFTRVSRKRSPF